MKNIKSAYYKLDFSMKRNSCFDFQEVGCAAVFTEMDVEQYAYFCVYLHTQIGYLHVENRHALHADFEHTVAVPTICKLSCVQFTKLIFADTQELHL